MNDLEQPESGEELELDITVQESVFVLRRVIRLTSFEQHR